MGKLTATIIVILSLFSVSFTVYASSETSTVLESTFSRRQFSSVYKLYEYWERNGYPDYVGGVYSTDGGIDNLTILLVNDDRSFEEIIRASIINASGVSFGRAKYSQNELKLIQEEIERNYMGTDKHVYGVGIGWTSVNGIVTGFGEEKNESRVVVGVDESVFNEYTDIFNDYYGDRVYVEVSEPFVLDSNETPKNNSLMVSILFIFISLICGNLIFQTKKGENPISQEKE